MRIVRLEEQEQARAVTESAASRPRLAKLIGKVRGEHILYVASIVGMIIPTTTFAIFQGLWKRRDT